MALLESIPIGSQKKNGMSLRVERENDPENFLESTSLQERIEQALNRCNSSREAYGNLRKRKILCFTFLFSPDRSSFYVTTIITFFIVACNLAVSSCVFTRWELVFAFTLLLIAFCCSFLVCSIDPGVYPRLKEGEVDPLSIFQGKIVFCRFCHVYRPPLTSHCHTCNVCILEHDHHCSILGGCVGKRTLRFFALYLLSLSIALCQGIAWIVRLLYIAFLVAVKTSNKTPFRLHDGMNSLPLPGPTLSSVGTNNSHSTVNTTILTTPPEKTLDLMYIPALFVLMIDIIVLLLVGVFTVMYVYFFLTSLTRRESQRGQGIRKTWRRLLSCNSVLHNFWGKCFPPPSRLADSSSNYSKELV